MLIGACNCKSCQAYYRAQERVRKEHDEEEKRAAVENFKQIFKDGNIEERRKQYEIRIKLKAKNNVIDILKRWMTRK